jgi:PBP1b-binding outer membrane lipoprotein LpoB
MKKIVLSLALVAMMFVSCKEAEATPEVVEETVVEEAPVEEAAPVAEDTNAVATETPAETPAK